MLLRQVLTCATERRCAHNKFFRNLFVNTEHTLSAFTTCAASTTQQRSFRQNSPKGCYQNKQKNLFSFQVFAKPNTIVNRQHEAFDFTSHVWCVCVSYVHFAIIIIIVVFVIGLERFCVFILAVMSSLMLFLLWLYSASSSSIPMSWAP